MKNCVVVDSNADADDDDKLAVDQIGLSASSQPTKRVRYAAENFGGSQNNFFRFRRPR